MWMFTHQCFCVLLFDCISLVFTGLVSRLIPVLPTHLPAALFVPGPVYLLCCQRGPFSGNPAHKRFHSYASSGRRPLLGVGDLFLCCCSWTRRPGVCCRVVLQGCRMWLWRFHTRGRLTDALAQRHISSEAAGALMSCLLYRQTAMRSAVWTQQIRRTTKR